jgi:glycosyltransferase involved in cell wall biosynthesis
MKVLVVHTFNQSQNGNDSVVKNEIYLLRGMGWEVEQLSPDAAKGSKLALALSTFFNYSSWKLIKARLSAYQPDIVHLHYLEYGTLAAAVYGLKQFGLPIVYTPHDYSLLCPSETLFFKDRLFKHSLKQGFPYKAINQAVYHKSKALTFAFSLSMFTHQVLGTWKRIDQMIVHGEAVREIFASSQLHALAGRISVNYPFTYQPVKHREPVDDSYYLYAGDLTDESGIPVLLESFADSGLPLKVAGHGYLSRLVYGYGEFYPNISLINSYRPEEIAGLFENASAIIFPSEWYDPFGSMIITAFSKGLPVIASDLGIASEIVTHGHNGLLFKAGNDKDLAEKVQQFQTLKWAERKNYRANAFQTYCRRFTPDKAAARLTSIYLSLLTAPLDGAIQSDIVQGP